MAKDNLIAKGFMLLSAAFISNSFIHAITEIVKDSVWQMKFIWPILAFIFIIVDIISYFSYGEELVLSFFEWLGDLFDRISSFFEEDLNLTA